MDIKSETVYSIQNLSRTKYEMLIEGLYAVAENISSENPNTATEYETMADRLKGML